MAKLQAFAAVVFAALIALSAATTYTTTTTVVTDDEIINTRHESCQVEIQGVQMTHCMKYLATLGGRYEEGEPSSFLRNRAVPRMEEHLQECCDEMRSVSPQCRGDTVRHIIKEMKEMWGQEEMQQMMMEKARAIPQKCNLRRSQSPQL